MNYLPLTLGLANFSCSHLFLPQNLKKAAIVIIVVSFFPQISDIFLDIVRAGLPFASGLLLPNGYSKCPH